MPKANDIEVPIVVDFVSQNTPCKAYCAFGSFGLNMRTCVINLGESPKVHIEYLPEFARVNINDGQFWFDTGGESAARIEALLLSKQEIQISTGNTSIGIGESIMVYQHPLEIGGETVISFVPPTFAGACKVLQDNGQDVLICVLPTYEDARQAAIYAASENGGFGSTAISAAGDLEVTHKNWQEWAF